MAGSPFTSKFRERKPHFDTIPESERFVMPKTEFMFITLKVNRGFVDKEPTYRCTGVCKKYYTEENHVCE